jgi:hypothetical protein
MYYSGNNYSLESFYIFENHLSGDIVAETKKIKNCNMVASVNVHTTKYPSSSECISLLAVGFAHALNRSDIFLFSTLLLYFFLSWSSSSSPPSSLLPLYSHHLFLLSSSLLLLPLITSLAPLVMESTTIIHSNLKIKNSKSISACVPIK